LFTTSGSGSSVFYFCHKVPYLSCVIVSISVPDPDPLDPHVFGPSGSGSGSTSQRFGSGSGSFYHQAKLVISYYYRGLARTA
jgi:hypothetical protein